MWSRLPKDVQNLILDAAASDEATIRAMSCVSRQWQHAMLFKAQLPLNTKAGICQFTRQFMQHYTAARNRQPLKRLWFSVFKDGTEDGLSALLKTSANHFNTFSYQDLPKNGVLRSNLTPAKQACLQQLGALEIYVLFLVEQGFACRDDVVTECIVKLEKIISANYPAINKDKFDAFQQLIELASDDEMSIYLRAGNLLMTQFGKSLSFG